MTTVRYQSFTSTHTELSATLFIDTEFTFDNIEAALAGSVGSFGSGDSGDGDDGIKFLPTEWAGTATIEVYMLSNLANPDELPCYFNQVGNFTGPELYGQIYQSVLGMCADADKDKDKDPKCENYSGPFSFPSKWPYPGKGMAVYCKYLTVVFSGATLLCRCETWDNNGRVSTC